MDDASRYRCLRRIAARGDLYAFVGLNLLDHHANESDIDATVDRAIAEWFESHPVDLPDIHLVPAERNATLDS